jgi:hypothetical protein
MSTTTAARKPLIDNTIANTDTQSLSISGHTISLTNGGSVTVPDNYRSISDSISSTSTSVSASSKAVKIAYDKGNHPHPYLPLSGGTLTGDLVISKTSPMLRLYDTNASIGNYPRIDFDTANNQGASIEFNEFDAELTIAGYGLVVGPSTTNTQFPTTGTLSLSVLGEIYAGGTSLKGLNKVFHDGYHPNADKWTTARTLSLTGDVTGSVSWDGSGNASLTATVADDSHNHDGRYYTETESDSRFVNTAGDTMSGTLTLSADTPLITSNGQYVNRKFTMIENANPQWIILCANGANNDVNGTIRLDRTSGNYQAATLEVIVSSGTSAMYGGALRSLQVLQNSEDYRLVSITHNGGNYIAIKYTGNSYPLTTGAYFTGRLVSTGVSLSVVSTGVTNEVPFGGNSEQYFDVDTVTTTGEFYAQSSQKVFHDGYHPNADKWTTARTLSLTGDVTGSVSWDGSGNASITAI